MAQEVAPLLADEVANTPRKRRRLARWTRGALAFFLAVLVLVGIGIAVLNSPIGHRFVTDQIAKVSPASGLKVTIGRIQGSLYGKATLRDVVLYDKRGPFLRVPVVELDWRPYRWFTSGLDVRNLVARRGTLMRVPELNPGDPDAPILPNFDIRVDRFEVDRLTVAEGIVGKARRISLLAKTDIRDGKVYLRADGRLGGQDRLFALLDAEPDRDKFDLKLDYDAPRGGLLSELAGMDSALRVRAGGTGPFSNWNGGVLVDRDGASLAALRLTNRKGKYAVLGLVRPQDLLSGIPARAAGASVAVGGQGTLVDSVINGNLFAQGRGLEVTAAGVVDLARNRLGDVRVAVYVRDPEVLGAGTRIEGARIAGTLAGPFRDLTFVHTLAAERLATGTTRLEKVRHEGTLAYDGARWTLPLNLTAGRIVTGNATIDPRLVNAKATGTIALFGTRLTSDNLKLDVPGLAARLALSGDTGTGAYALAGPVTARGLALENLGSADADARIVLRFGSVPWLLDARVTGRMARVSNPTLTSLAGTGIRFAGNVSVGAQRSLLFERATLSGSKLALGVSGRLLPGGRTTIVGSGRHVDYGPFTVDAAVSADGPRGVLVFADPLPAAGLRNVRVALSPVPDGFRIETAGGSTLGPFEGVLGLFMRPGAPARIDVERLAVWQTNVTGSLTIGASALSGRLALAGGGIDGTIMLTPREGGQGFDVALTADNARFGGGTPITVSTARIEAQGLFRDGRSTITGTLNGQGIGYGRLFLGRVAVNAGVVDGRGRFTAALSGRRGSRFDLQLVGDVAPERTAVAARGDFAGRRITMPRRAVLTSVAGGWRLAPTQVNFADGRMIVSGVVGGRETALDLALADMPLSVADILVADLGLGGKISGLVTYRQPSRGVPTGDVKIQIAGLTRSGLVLTSRPVDVAIVGRLGASSLETRAVVREGGQIRGRLQGRITGLVQAGALMDRLSRGALFAQLRYSGPADALWRLAALDAFDLTGPLTVAADVTGSIDSPSIRGSLASDSLRLQSSLTGTDMTSIRARGSFAGSRLQLSSLSGRTAGGGTVSGSGSFDLSGLGSRGPGIDLRLAARSARILARDDMAASVTGPLRIQSDGINGVIAGRLAIDKASWRLGQASAVARLPDVRTREINRAVDIAPPTVRMAPWRYLIDASAPGEVDVRGLGLDSEWSADVKLRGNTNGPIITGRADLVRGGYEFAGKRFELVRGQINFDGNSPPNPRLDIVAEAELTGLNARVSVAGTSLKPEITFSSTPALPEEELLARILFGNSISDISAPEALQLGVALAGLRGGGGMDPINRLRTAIGLDRLRIVGADAATGRGTSIAVGKNFGRRFYAEIISDGRGYSATQLEFRITSWLSLLASVSTLGRESMNVQVSRDY